MKKPYGLLWILVLLSAALMSLPWLVPHCGALALIAFLPLLTADRVADQNGVRHFWIWHYSTFVLWNAATTFWVANATLGGAVFAILANSLQMSLVFGLFRFSKKRLGGVLPYVFLAAAWIAWERWYLVSAEISWPWLVLGNAFARSIRLAQWYEFTGTLGGSLWVWTSNLSLFGLMVAVLEGGFFRWKRGARFCAAMGAILVVALPIAASAHLWHHWQEESEGSVDVVIAQPNFDPYEKFRSVSREEQNSILLGQYRESLASMAADSTWDGLLVAPETFTQDIVLGMVPSSRTWQDFNAFLQGYPKADLLFGAATYEIFERRSSPSILARPYGDGWIQGHNSAFVTDASGREEVFHKSKLVVGTEMTPYPKFFVPIDNWLGKKLGTGSLMGRDIGQDSISTLNVLSGGRKVPFGCAICYESVYPEYCTGYVKEGAEFMTIITNDAWWGDTPGYRQHLSYASLRAIELRRDIARCGNTGISAFINQRGEIGSQSSWWQRETLEGMVNLASGQTFFVRNGDIAGRACTLMFLLLLAALLVRLFVRKP